MGFIQRCENELRFWHWRLQVPQVLSRRLEDWREWTSVWGVKIRGRWSRKIGIKREAIEKSSLNWIWSWAWSWQQKDWNYRKNIKACKELHFWRFMLLVLSSRIESWVVFYRGYALMIQTCAWANPNVILRKIALFHSHFKVRTKFQSWSPSFIIVTIIVIPWDINYWFL